MKKILTPIAFAICCATTSLNATAGSATISISISDNTTDESEPEIDCTQDLPESLRFDLILEVSAITPGFAILEGPIWIDGSLVMSHIGFNVDGVSPSDRIAWRDGLVTVLQEDYLSNGLTINHLGNVVAARHFDGTITGVENARIFASQFQGARFNSPNDLVFSSRGDLYFTDPSFQAPTEGTLQSADRSYHVTPFGGITAFGTDTINDPNGVFLSQDEQTLYVGGSNGLFKFELSSIGAVVGNPVQILADDIPEGVDGMSRDLCGNLFVAAAGKINVISADEEFLFSTEIPGITNIAFGGDSGRDIYATTLGGTPAVFRASGQWPIEGLPY